MTIEETRFPAPITTRELARISGVSPQTVFNYLQMFKIPHRVELLPNGRRRFLYDRSAIERLEAALAANLARRRARRGLIRCRGFCGRYFRPDEMRSRICAECRAAMTAKNFSHRGDPCRNPFDPQLAQLLLDACRKLLQR